MDFRKKIADTIMKIDPHINPIVYPTSHYGLYPYFLEIRQDIHIANMMLKKVRKRKLRDLYEEDMKRENEDLRMIGKCYMISQ